MADVGIKELLEAGVHFGHQTRRWNPRMRRFIHGEREGIHIIDLLQTEELLNQATEFVARGGRQGRRRSSSSAPRSRLATRSRSWAERCGMPYVNRRWLGGLLTNFNTISQADPAPARAARAQGGRPPRPAARPRSGCRWRPSCAKLEYNLGGVADMQRLPDAVIIIDLKTEEIALAGGRAPGDPDRRPGRHELRPDPVDLRRSRATTTRSAPAT